MRKEAILEIIFKAIDNVSPKLDDLGKRLGGMGGPFAALGKIASQAFDVATTAATGLVAGIMYVSDAAATFEQKMANVNAVMNITQDQYAILTDEVMRLGRETIFTATEAADAVEALARGGATFEQIMRGAGQATLDLASATKSGMKETASIMLGVMNMFEIVPEKAGHAADVIAGAINTANMTLTDFNYAMMATGTLSHELGMSLEDVAAGLAMFGRAGIVGEKAGTGLKTMMLNLIPKTKDAAGVFEKYGFIINGVNQFFDESTGKVKSSIEVYQLLAEKLGAVDTPEKVKALQDMFGQRSAVISELLVGMRDGGAKVEEFYKILDGSSAAEIAAERLDSLKGSQERLKGEWETATIVLGQAFLPLIRQGTDFLEKMLSAAQPMIKVFAEWVEGGLAKLPAKLAELTGIDLSKLTGALGAFEGKDFGAGLTAFFDKLLGEGGGAKMDGLIGNLGKLGEMILKVGGWLLEFATSQSTIDVISGSLEAFFAIVQGGVDAWNAVAEGIDAFKQDLADLGVELDEAGQAWASIGPNISAAVGEAERIFSEWVAGLAGWGQEAIDGLLGGLGNFAESANKWITDGLAGIQQGWDNFWAGFGGVGTILAAFAPLAASMGTIFEEVKATVSAKWTEISVDVSTKVAAISLDVSTKWEEIKIGVALKLTEIGADISAKWAAFLTEVQTKGKAILDDIVAKWGEIKQSIADTLNLIWNELKLKWDAFLREISDKMKAILGEITKKWSEIKTSVSTALQSMWDDLTAKFTEMRNTASRLVGELKAEALRIAGELVSGALAKWQQMSTDAQIWWADLKAKAWAKIDELKTTAMTKAGEIVSGLLGFWKTLVSDAERWWGELKTKAQSAVQKVIDGFSGWAADIARGAVALGKSLVEGLWQGVVDMSGWLWDKITGWVAGLIGGTHEAGGGGSPWKKMMPVGAAAAMGFAIGFHGQWTQQESGVAAAVRNTVQRIAEVTADQMAMLKAPFSGENGLDYERARALRKAGMDMNRTGRGGAVAASSRNYYDVWSRRHGIKNLPPGMPTFPPPPTQYGELPPPPTTQPAPPAKPPTTPPIIPPMTFNINLDVAGVNIARWNKVLMAEQGRKADRTNTT